MSRNRQTSTLRRPPDEPSALKDFPTESLRSDRPLYRVVKQGNGPWWFGSSLEGRFDLPEPDGTCYLAADELAALLELIAPDREGGAVSSEFLKIRLIRELRVPRTFFLSDFTARRASGFGITAEIGTSTPYDLPQSWAARLHQAGSNGVVYWLRHDPSRTEGFALFDLHGERAEWDGGRERHISAELIERLTEECGIEVLDVPRASELKIIDGKAS